jgi:predicted dehydrogenase
MIGGGKGAFIGAVHRIASRMDNEYELVCGVFSSNPEISRESGTELGMDPERVYPSFKKLIENEKALPAEVRAEVIAIVTPNHVHAEPAMLAMENGFNVIMDKPMTINLAEALQLKATAERTGMLFCLTHTYTGYPMVKEARQQVLSGKLGTIRKVYVEYPQGWLSTPLEKSGQKQAEWRSDPTRNGIGGALGDIGTHAFNLAEYVSGLSIERISADINRVVEGRLLDDDASVLLKFSNGASGILFATQVAAGEENNISIRIYGEEGGLLWQQNDANSLTIKWRDRPVQTLRAGANIPYLSSHALHNCRTPGGHPEGYLEAFANHYRNFALTLKAKEEGVTAPPEWLDYPGIEDGVRGMAFIEAAVKSGQSTDKWVGIEIK